MTAMFDFKIEKVEFGEVGDDLFYYPLNSLDSYGFQTRNLPSSLKVILESLLRHYDSKTINFEHFNVFRCKFATMIGLPL